MGLVLQSLSMKVHPRIAGVVVGRWFPTTEDDLGRKGVASSAEMSPTARDSVDAFAVGNDQMAQGTEKLNTHPETLLRGGLAEPTIGIASYDVESHMWPIAHSGEANSEVTSNFPSGRTHDSKPRVDEPANAPQSASPFGVSDLEANANLSVPSHPTVSGIIVEPRAKEVGKNSWLAPYIEWTSAGTVPDLRDAPNQAELVSLLAEIATTRRARCRNSSLSPDQSSVWEPKIDWSCATNTESGLRSSARAHLQRHGLLTPGEAGFAGHPRGTERKEDGDPGRA